MKDYITIAGEGNAEFLDKKSRFIGVCSPCSTENEALELIQREKKKYPDATHHVYAYSVRDNNIKRYSDDGEPSGTAGIPVLDVIQKMGLCDICIVVTRYFGGTLLGTGGLVHAYSRAAADAVSDGKVCTMSHCTIFSAVCDYAMSGKLIYALENSEADILSKDFSGNVTITCATGDFDAIKKLVTETSSGRATVSFIEERFIAR